jgi:hypothetical protein
MLSNDACASTHCRFDQFATADARLPFQPAICLRGFYVDISLAGLLGVRPSNRVRWRWNDDPCVHGMTENRTVGWMAIIGSIGSELVDLIIDLIKQRRQLRDTAGFLICQAMCDDLATAGINSQMQLSSAAPGGRQTKDARIRVAGLFDQRSAIQASVYLPMPRMRTIRQAAHYCLAPDKMGREVEGSVEKARIFFPEISSGSFGVDIEAKPRRFQ